MSMSIIKKNNLNWKRIDSLIKIAIAEDIENIGDITSENLLPNNLKVVAYILIKEKGICAGLPIVEYIFKKIDKNIKFTQFCKDGISLEPNSIIASVYGNAKKILLVERIVLNFLQRLCGIATITRKYVDLLQDSHTKILDTRKTIPGYRNIEKYAVNIGCGMNHRMGLYDTVLIKDNHFRCLLISKYKKIDIIKKILNKYKNNVIIEISTIDEFIEFYNFVGIKHILLDNMINDQLKEIVNINKNKFKLEVSGGICLSRISFIKKLGIDFISVGNITHSAKAIDISLKIL